MRGCLSDAVTELLETYIQALGRQAESMSGNNKKRALRNSTSSAGISKSIHPLSSPSWSSATSTEVEMRLVVQAKVTGDTCQQQMTMKSPATASQ